MFCKFTFPHLSMSFTNRPPAAARRSSASSLKEKKRKQTTRTTIWDSLLSARIYWMSP